MTDHPTTGQAPHGVRLGILGLGAVAQAVHLPLVERLRDHFVIAALADLSTSLAEAVGDRYRVPAERRHASLDEMLGAGGLDALVVLSSGSHGRAVLAGLDRGLAVFAEKPLVWTLAEADAIEARLAADPGLRLQVGYMKLYDPAVVRAVAIAGEERLGPPRSIEVTVLHPSSESQLAFARLLPPPSDVPPATAAALRAEADELRRAALGERAAEAVGELYTAILLGSIVHELALVRAFAGDPEAIDAVAVWPADRWPPSVEFTGRLPADGRVTVRWHFLPDYAAYREEVRVVYEAATIELAFPSPYLLHRPTGLTVTTLDGQARRDASWTSTGEAFEEELLAFHALVTAGRPPAAALAEGRADVVTCQRIAARRARDLGIDVGGEAAHVGGEAAR